jgi:hypothetical protein
MPTIAQSATTNSARGSVQSTDTAMPVSTAHVSGVVQDENTMRSSFMHCAMPVLASTYDSLTRQFYGNPRVPTTRILPIPVKR